MREITIMMGQEVKFQGEQLNLILDDIEIAKNNAQYADSLISEAEKNSRRQMKKILMIVLLIFLIVSVIVGVVLLVTLSK